MCRCQGLLSLALAITCAVLPRTANGAACTPPPLNLAATENSGVEKGLCTELRRVCADNGEIITFDPTQLGNLTRATPYGVVERWSGLWNFPTRGGANSDALFGHQPNTFVAIRPASRMEANPALQNPQFSSCTMPFIMVTDWPYNMGEVLAQLASIVHVFIRDSHVTDDSATLVVATPAGLALTPFHHVLLSPYSRYPVINLEELSARQAPGARVPWSAEGTHVSCFERAVLCKIHGVKSIAPLAHAVLTKLEAEGKLQPPDPLGFAQPGAALPPLATDTTLRVVLEARMGSTRSIRNLHQVVEQCEAANKRGFTAGSFTRLSCRILHTGDTPQLHGVNRYYANLASVRSAHVLVAVHGAGAANCFFLQEDNGGTALIEIRPCAFGTTHCGWPDAYMNSQLSWAGNGIRFFAYNIEDPDQCQPSDYEALARSDPSAPMRGNEAMRARDQHLTLKPGPFVEMLRHVGSLLRNDAAYKEAQASNSLHGYPIPGGLRLGPLCARNVSRTTPPGGRFIEVA